ncbi:MAG: NADH-quinone oxidoreductase subunit A [Epsilonproteobacteria bacterium]|nr:NADH-quinone oxidoreductase subunit A [Campylobacterota bacterium]
MSQELLLSGSIILLISLLIPILFLLTKNLGPRNSDVKNKNITYESGVTYHIGDISNRHNIRYYLVAIIFVIFDVEIIFLFPWAVNVRELGGFGIVEMFLFIFLLLAGLAYVYMKRAIKWQ